MRRFGLRAAMALAPLLLAAGPPAGPPEQPDQGPVDVLQSKGLRRSGNAFVLSSEQRVVAGLAALGKLASANQEELRRRGLRSVITAQSQSLLADLQAWQLALNGLNYGNLFPPSLVPGPFGPQLPVGPGPFGAQGGLDDLSYLNQQQINNMFQVVAGVEAQNAYEAAEALARQDDFDRGRDAVRRAIAALDREYNALRADFDVPAALGVLTREENRPVTLGPLGDYAAKLDELDRAMAETRRLTTPVGATAPAYGVAATLADGARLNLRLALGALRAWEREAAANPADADASRGEALRRDVAARKDRFARSVLLLRKAYDAYSPPPPIKVTLVEPVTNAPEPGKIREAVERHRARLRAAFVAEAERAVQTVEVPMELGDGGPWVVASLNGGPDVRMRVDPAAPEVWISEKLAGAIGLVPDPKTGLGTIASLKLGAFRLTEVRCRVGPGDDSPAVLGASALGRFLSEVRADDEPPALTLTWVNVPPLAPRPRPVGAPPAKEKR